MIHKRAGWVLRLAGLDEKLADAILDGLRKLFGEMAEDPAHPVRARMEEGLADLAQRLGLVRKAKRGNFEAPGAEGRDPTLACYPAKNGAPSMWKDFRTDEHGDAIALYQMKSSCDFPTAVRELARMYGVEIRRPDAPAVRVEPTLAEFIGDKCLSAACTDDGRATLVDYLASRGIGRSVIDNALRRRTLGRNT